MATLFSCVLPFNLAVFAFSGVAACAGPRDEAELRDTLWGTASGYNSIVRPAVALSSYGSANATPVEAQLYIHDLYGIDQRHGKVTIQAKQYSIWWDARLTWNGTANGGCFDEVDFPGEVLKELWRPDLFWLGLSEPDVEVRRYFKLRNDGRILDNRLIFLKLRCEMDLRNMPYDDQTCSVRLGTYRENLAQVRLDFRDNTPIRMDPHVTSQEFELKSVSGDNPLEGLTTGTESRLDFRLHFRRDPVYYERYHFIPECFLVMTSWLSFFVDRQAVPARATLALVCLLATIVRYDSLLKHIPPVPYQVFATNFISICVYFQVYAAIEFAVANYLLRVEKRFEAGKDVGKLYYCCLNRDGHITLLDQHLDIFSRIAYPVAFAIAMTGFFASV